MCNFTEVEEADIVLLAALRGGAALLCAVVNFLLLTTITVRLNKTSPLHRLLVYLAISSLVMLGANILQVESVFCHSPWYLPACEFAAFMNHFTGWMLMLVCLWLAVVLALHYWCPNDRIVLTPRKDVVVWCGIVLFSMLVASVPLVTRGYGMNQAWCWLKSAHIAEQWALWYSWVVATPGLVMLILVTAVWQSGKRQERYYESSRGINNTKQQRSKEAVKKMKTIVVCIGVYWAIITLAIVLRQIPQIKRTLTFLVAVAILEPLSIVAIPVVFITHLYDYRRPVASQTAHSVVPHLPQHQQQRRTSETLTSASINHSSCNGDESEKTSKSKQRELGKKGYKGQHYKEELTSSLLLTETLSSEYSDNTRDWDTPTTWTLWLDNV